MSQWASLKERAAGKWQGPLFLLSVVLFVAAFWRATPRPAEMPIDQALARLNAWVRGGLHEDAIQLGSDLFRREGITPAQRGTIHLELGRAWTIAAEKLGARHAGIGEPITKHFVAALERNVPLAAEDHCAMGRAYEWQRRIPLALEHYARAVEKGVAEPLALRKHMLNLRLTRVYETPEAASKAVDSFLSEVGDQRLDLRLWGLERKLRLLDKSDALEEATTLLARNRDLFKDSPERPAFMYLEAWILYKGGYYDHAENYLRNILNQLPTYEAVYARTGWLLGRTILADGGPQRPLEAHAFFSDVVEHHPDDPYAVASWVGMGEALAMLERHIEALEMFREAIVELAAAPGIDEVDQESVRSLLGVLSEGQRQAGRWVEAVEYARLAAGLIDPNDVETATVFLRQLAQAQAHLAEALDGGSPSQAVVVGRPLSARSARARKVFGEAASTYLLVAQVTVLHENLGAEAGWQAAELFVRAGNAARAIRLYRTFAREHSQHALVPRSLLRVGQLHQTAGRLGPAIEAYKECYRRFPRSIDGSRALVPLAQCYLAAEGPESDELGERTVRIVLEDSEVFTPEAPEFADALFLLGDALDRMGQFERAIATLEEALERYPDDKRVMRARYLLADSYRRSGLALRSQAQEARYVGEIQQLRRESLNRLRTAKELYWQMIQDYEARNPASLNRLEQAYLRHAYLYEADCCFETQDYRRALKLYEEAAAMYKDSPSSLAAYVQIINSHVFLGETNEARAALARAGVLVDAMPDRVFAESVSPETRGDWQRYFEWLGKSDLF